MTHMPYFFPSKHLGHLWLVSCSCFQALNCCEDLRFLDILIQSAVKCLSSYINKSFGQKTFWVNIASHENNIFWLSQTTVFNKTIPLLLYIYQSDGAPEFSPSLLFLFYGDQNAHLVRKHNQCCFLPFDVMWFSRKTVTGNVENMFQDWY